MTNITNSEGRRSPTRLKIHIQRGGNDYPDRAICSWWRENTIEQDDDASIRQHAQTGDICKICLRGHIYNVYRLLYLEGQD